MKTQETFGQRLKKVRKSRGLSQEALAEKISSTRRIIGYYEAEASSPPGKILAELSKALNVPIDMLLGMEPIREDKRTVDAKFWPKWQHLSEDEKKTVSKLVETLLIAKTG